MCNVAWFLPGFLFCYAYTKKIKYLRVVSIPIFSFYYHSVFKRWLVKSSRAAVTLPCPEPDSGLIQDHFRVSCCIYVLPGDAEINLPAGKGRFSMTIAIIQEAVKNPSNVYGERFKICNHASCNAGDASYPRHDAFRQPELVSGSLAILLLLCQEMLKQIQQDALRHSERSEESPECLRRKI
jgi:hypothetical protein